MTDYKKKTNEDYSSKKKPTFNEKTGILTTQNGKASTHMTTESPNYKFGNMANDDKRSYENTANPDGYTSQYEELIRKNLDRILNQPDFEYDVNADKLYNQYREKYTKAGQKAMQDTMGNAAALSGGYGNSYAALAGQSAYNSYMDQLSDKVPELEAYAYQKWLNAQNELYNRADLLQSLDSADYGRYRDSMNDFYANREYDYRAAQDKLAQDNWQKQYDRSVYENDRNYDRSVYESDRDYDYRREQDKQSQDNWQKQYDRSVYESDRDYDYRREQDKQSQANWEKQYDRSVYESDRDYGRRVYEDNRDYNYRVNSQLQQIIDSKKDTVDDSSYFNPEKAYSFLDKYGDNIYDKQELVETLFQMYGAQDGFYDWLDRVKVDGTNESYLDVLYSMYPDLYSDSEAASGDFDIYRKNQQKQTESEQWKREQEARQKKNEAIKGNNKNSTDEKSKKKNKPSSGGGKGNKSNYMY